MVSIEDFPGANATIHPYIMQTRLRIIRIMMHSPGRKLLLEFISEGVAEGNLEVGGAHFVLVANLKFVAVGRNEVCAPLHADVILGILEATADVPAHLETVPCVVLVAHVLLAVAVDISPVSGIFRDFLIAIVR